MAQDQTQWHACSVVQKLHPGVVGCGRWCSKLLTLQQPRRLADTEQGRDWVRDVVASNALNGLNGLI